MRSGRGGDGGGDIVVGEQAPGVARVGHVDPLKEDREVPGVEDARLAGAERDVDGSLVLGMKAVARPNGHSRASFDEGRRGLVGQLGEDLVPGQRSVEVGVGVRSDAKLADRTEPLGYDCAAPYERSAQCKSHASSSQWGRSPERPPDRRVCCRFSRLRLGFLAQWGDSIAVPEVPIRVGFEKDRGK